jgi:hypothetical protein
MGAACAGTAPEIVESLLMEIIDREYYLGMIREQYAEIKRLHETNHRLECILEHLENTQPEAVDDAYRLTDTTRRARRFGWCRSGTCHHVWGCGTMVTPKSLLRNKQI